MSLSVAIVRLACYGTTKPVDINTGGYPVVFRGAEATFQIGILAASSIVTADNLVSVEVQIKDPDDLLGEPLASGTDLAPNTALTQAEWDDGTSQHAVIPLTATELNFDIGSASAKELWIVVAANIEDGERVILGCCKITMIEHGLTSDTPVPTMPPAARIKNGKLQIKSPDNDLYYDFVPRLISGFPSASFEGEGEI